MSRLTFNRVMLTMAGLAAITGLTLAKRPTEAVMTFLMAILVSKNDG